MESMKRDFEVGKAVEIDRTAVNGKKYIAIVEAFNEDGTMKVCDWGNMTPEDVTPADPHSKGVKALEQQWREKRRDGFIKENQKAEIVRGYRGTFGAPK